MNEKQAPSSGDTNSNNPEAENDNDWVVVDAVGETENVFPENKELSRPEISRSKRIEMLEKRFTSCDVNSLDDRKVVLYGDLDRPLDENLDSNTRRSTLRTHPYKNRNDCDGKIRKTPVCGTFLVKQHWLIPRLLNLFHQ